MLIHLWELLILLLGDCSAMVMAAIQVSPLIIVISIEEIHNMPYIPKRKRPPRNRILACGNHLMRMVYMHLDACINSSMIRHHKQHHKWKKICNNKHKWCNRTGLSKVHCNMHKMSTHFKDKLQKNSFDSDSHPLMFDDGASASITSDLQEFVRKPAPII